MIKNKNYFYKFNSINDVTVWRSEHLTRDDFEEWFFEKNGGTYYTDVDEQKHFYFDEMDSWTADMIIKQILDLDLFEEFHFDLANLKKSGSTFITFKEERFDENDINNEWEYVLDFELDLNDENSFDTFYKKMEESGLDEKYILRKLCNLTENDVLDSWD